MDNDSVTPIRNADTGGQRPAKFSKSAEEKVVVAKSIVPMASELTATGGSRCRLGVPATYRLHSPHADVSFLIEIRFDNDLMLEYIGAPAALVAAGVCTPELLGRWKPGRARVDKDGDRAFLDRRKTWVRLRLRKSIENALKLPGVTLTRIEEERDAWRRACADPAAPPWMRDQLRMCETPAAPARTSRSRPHLRLVVDNTRRMREGPE
jgi:hypothetical protein